MCGDVRSPVAVTLGMNTENKVPAWVASGHLRRSILHRSTQIRWAYRSSSPAWPMAGSGTRGIPSTVAVHRSVTSHDRGQNRPAIGRQGDAVTWRRYSVAAWWSLIWVTFDMPDMVSGSARRLARHLGDIVRAGTAGEVGDPWVSALPCRRRPAHRRCPGRMTVAIVWAAAAAPIRWWCTACDDEGVISNWADSPYDLRRRRLSVAGDVEEVIVSDATAAVLRELVSLDRDRERLVFGMRAHRDGAALRTSVDDLEALCGFVAAEANHESNRRRRHRLNAAFNALTEAVQTFYR